MNGHTAPRNRLPAIVAVVAALALLVAAFAAPASDAKKKKSCKKGKEKSGCTLKAGAAYTGPAGGGPRVHMNVYATSTGITFRISGGFLCKPGGSTTTNFDFRQGKASGKPKIGKSYSVNSTEHFGTNSLGSSDATVTGTIKLASASKATADLKLVYKEGPNTICDIKVPAPSLGRAI